MPQIASATDHPKPVTLQDDADQGMSPGEILRMLWRHKLFIILCALACFSLALGYVLVKHPVYEATATIRIDPGRTNSLGLSDLATGAGPADTSDLIHTEIAVMQGDGVALRTLRDLPDNEFVALTDETKHDADLPETVQELTPAQSDFLSAIQLPLIIKQEEGTSLITVSFRDKNARLAADVVNHLVAAYFVQSYVDRDRSVSQLNGWLSAQMASIKAQVNTAQQQLADFEQKNHVLPTEGTTSNSITDRLRLLSDRLTAAQSDRITKEGQLRAAESGNVTVLAALFPTSRLQDLQGEQTTVTGKYQQLHSKFGANYPPLIEAEQQVKAVDNEIANEIQAIRGRLQEEYVAARTSEDLLRREYEDQTSLALALDRHATEYAVLQAEVVSNRTLYDTLRRNVQQAGVDAQINGLNTMPVDYAYAPAYPVLPKKALVLGGGLVLGLFAGIAAALLMEANSDKLHSVAQLTKVAPYTIITTIPAETKTRRRSSGTSAFDSLVMARSGHSQVAEAFRALRNFVILRASEQDFRSLLVTGTSRREFTGEVAANTALALAQVRKRILLVDTDLAEPSLHRYFDLENGIGLGDVLNGTSKGEVYRRPMPEYGNLVLLTAGTQHPGASEELVQEAFTNLLREWQADFDFVVLKSAPIAEQSSGLLLAHWTDQLLVVARHQETELGTYRDLHTMLDRAGAHVLGVVVENVPQTS